MFFSVSVPIYNKEKYIDRCIESIVNQEFDDYEIVLVNDGSNDSSLDKCILWREKYPELIRIINKENRGSLMTRRTCIEESLGKYLYIMDADDYLINCDFLKNAKSLIENSQCDLLLFNATSSEDGRKYFKYPFDGNRIFEGESLKELYLLLLKGDSLNSLWIKIFSREIVDKNVDYSVYSHVTNGTDLFQSIPIIFNANRAFYWDSVEYYYQISNNKNSIVHSFKNTIYLSLRESYICLIKYCEERIGEDSSVKELLKIRMMMIASTSAYKIRLLSEYENESALDYISNIGDDDLFRRSYDENLLRRLSWPRRSIVKMLYNKNYRALVLAIRLMSKIV